MDQAQVFDKVHDLLRQIGAAGMRIAANGPTVGMVLCRAQVAGATGANIREAKTLVGMALDQYSVAPEHAGLVAEARAILATIN